MLPEGTRIRAVLNMIVPEEELLKRLSTRGRQDDELETIRRRLRIYHDTTEPLAEYYRGKGILVDIYGVGGIEDITNQILTAVNGKKE
jgi:adenylate kinase